jgi:hypothetical protein
MFSLFAPKHTPAMVPLWSLVAASCVSAMVGSYVTRALRVVERWVWRGLTALRKAARDARQGRVIRVKAVDSTCGEVVDGRESEG